MMSKNVDSKRANDLSALLKCWYDGDEKEGIVRPLSSLTATKKNSWNARQMLKMERNSRKYEKCGGKKGYDYGKFNFYDVYKDYVNIGGKHKKPLSDSCKDIKIKIALTEVTNVKKLHRSHHMKHFYK